MNFLSIGVNHKTAPIEIREKLYFTENELPRAYDKLLGKYGFREAVILSTCNRTEIYTVTDPFAMRYGDLFDFITELKRARNIIKPDFFYRHFASGSANHLFRVATGIDSMIIGDIQILAQLKESFNFAEKRKASGFLTNRLFNTAFRVGKRVRAETAIGEGAVSIPYAAVELANKIFADLSSKRVLLIGAGETGKLTAKHLADKGIGELIVANRTASRSEELVKQLGGKMIEFNNFIEEFRTCDIVISAAASDNPIVTVPMLSDIMKKRKADPLFIIDIGMPRNIDPACNKFENLFLHDIDALENIVDRNLAKRKSEVPRIESLIKTELKELFDWYNSLQLNPTISELRQIFEFIRKTEVEKHANKFSDTDREMLDMMTRRIINKILHLPMTALRTNNGAPEKDTLSYISSLRKLFGLGKEEE